MGEVQRLSHHSARLFPDVLAAPCEPRASNCAFFESSGESFFLEVEKLRSLGARLVPAKPGRMRLALRAKNTRSLQETRSISQSRRYRINRSYW